MSGLLWMFLIKRAKKVVWASVKVVDSLVLAILMVVAGRAFLASQVSWWNLENGWKSSMLGNCG